MTLTNTWLPNPQLLERDENALTAQLVSSIVGLAASGEPHTAAGSGVLKELQNAADADAGSLLHPELFQFYYASRQRGHQPARVLDLLSHDVLPKVSASRARARRAEAELSLPWDVRTGAFSELTSMRLAAASAVAAQRQASVSPIEHLESEHATVLRAALRRVQAVWPEMHAELAQTVQCLVPITAQSAIGAADLCSHGTVYMNLRRFSDATKLAEELIHEASHIRLNMLMAPRDVVLNAPAERYASPLRRDARPMFGVFHQVFVLSRIMEFYRRIARMDPTQARHVSAVSRQLADGLSIVQRHGRLSEVGKELLCSMCQLSDTASAQEN